MVPLAEAAVALLGIGERGVLVGAAPVEREGHEQERPAAGPAGCARISRKASASSGTCSSTWLQITMSKLASAKGAAVRSA